VNAGALAWVASIPAGGNTLAAVDIAAGPTSDVLLADVAQGSTLEQRRWSKSGAALSVHQDPAGAYAGPMIPSTLIVDSNNQVFYGVMLTGLPQGAKLGAKLMFNLLTPAGAPVFSESTTNALPSASGAAVVNLFHAAFDVTGGLHAALAVPAKAPQYFSSGVYCYAADGSSVVVSASNAVAPLAATDAIWITQANDLWAARTVSATTDFGCGAPLAVPAAGGIALVRFNGDGGCISNALLALPNAAVQERAFRLAADGSLLFAVVYSGTIDFGGGPLHSSGTTSLAVARFDANGTFLAAKTFGGAGSSFAGVSVAGNAGAIVVKSGFGGTVDLGGGPLPSTGDTFVAAFDTQLASKWTRVVSVGTTSVLMTTAAPCGVALATNGAAVDLGTGRLSDGQSIGVAALGW
jgi:hypothetical protein